VCGCVLRGPRREQAQQELSLFSQTLMRERAALLVEQDEPMREAAAAREVDRQTLSLLALLVQKCEC
jgi:hypothetical protein